MKDQSWTGLVSRDNFHSGPWDSEPDKIQWTDKATGLPCLIVRNDMGALCGYVGLPKDHPLFSKDYDTPGCRSLTVHGGLTYSNFCSGDVCHTVEPGEDDRVRWLGFDCSHAGDLLPCSSKIMVDMLGSSAYRDVGYVRSQVAELARQLKAKSRG